MFIPKSQRLQTAVVEPIRITPVFSESINDS